MRAVAATCVVEQIESISSACFVVVGLFSWSYRTILKEKTEFPSPYIYLANSKCATSQPTSQKDAYSSHRLQSNLGRQARAEKLGAPTW